MSEFSYARGRIAHSINFILQEIDEYEREYRRKTRQDYMNDKKLQKLIEKTVENILTALIETCGTILAEEAIAVESYAETLRRCGELLGLKESECNRLAKLAAERNKLAHHYLNFRWEAVERYCDSSKLIVKMLRFVADREKRKRV